MAKKSKSPLIQQVKDREDKKSYTLTPEEAEQDALITKRIIRARNQREQSRDEFDGMSYEQVYLSNKRAAMSYLTPKKNDDEVRINTGTTEKKIEVVLNELLSLNLEGEVRAFDKEDNLLKDVGEVFTDITIRTEQIEHARDKDIYFYKELLTQPSVFVEELWIKEKTKELKTRNRCERRLIQGPQIYLGDINIPDTRWNEQPFLVKYARMSYDEGKRIFEELNPERWQYVHPGIYQSLGSANLNLYRKGSLENDEIEAFWYFSYPDNELQLKVNGIPFYKIGKKYTDEYGDLGGYHITMVGLNPYSGDFAYSKPLTQSAKTLQALNNETIRNLIRKFRQALEPPLGVPRGKIFSRDIWNPGAMVQGVKANDFSKLIDHVGVTQSEMAMFDLIEKKTAEFLGTPQQDPLSENARNQTATALVLAQKQAIKLLGLSVLAAMRLKDKLVILRVKNILENYTKPVSKSVDPITNQIREVYAKFSLEGADIEGQEGTRSIQLMDRGLTRDEELSMYAEEQRGKEEGSPIQMRTLNVPALMDLDLYFYVSVVAKERESTQLDRAMFQDMLSQGVGVSQIAGRPMKPDKLIDKFERVWKEKDLFEKAPPQQMPMMQQGMQAGMKPNIKEMAQGGNLNQMPGVGDII